MLALDNACMLQAHAFTAPQFKAQDLHGLSPAALAEVAAQMLAQIHSQSQRIAAQSQQIAERDRAIKFRDAKPERITFELARMKAWKFAARTEAMNAEQRQLFEETLAADEARLQAQLEALQAQAVTPPAAALEPKRQPRRQALPEHLERVVHHHEPENTICPTADCGQPMQRVGQDVSERLDIVPAQFFVHRHIRGKWARRCCPVLVQEPVAPQIIDGGMPAAGLVAHTLVSRFVDHLPYYRQETINARSNVHTPRSTLAAWSGRGGAALVPLFDVHREFVLGSQVLHADETPVDMLDPGAGKTKKAYVWAYARGGFDAQPGVAYDLQRWPRCEIPDGVPAWLGRHAGARRVQGLRERAQARRANGCRLPGARAAQVRRVDQGQPEPGGAAGGAAHRADLPRRARGPRVDGR